MQDTTFVHYKNGIIHSQNNSQQPSTTISLYDNGAVFIGQYLSHQPHGKCLLVLSPSLYFMGSLRKGLLQGAFTLRSPHLHIYANTVNNKIQGQVVIVDRVNKKARVWQIQNSQGVCIRQAQYQQHLSQEKILRAISPYTDTFPSLLEYFLKDRYPPGLSVQTTKGKKKTQVTISSDSHRKLSVHFQPERLIAVGVVEDRQFNGLGYISDGESGIQIEGQLKGGMLDGEGIKREIVSGKAIFGKFVRGDIRSLQVMDAKNYGQGLLSSIKKRVHLHALQFVNDYLNERPVYLLRNFYQTMLQNQQRYDDYLKQYGQKSNRQPNVIGLSRQPSKDELVYSIGQYNLIKQALSSRK